LIKEVASPALRATFVCLLLLTGILPASAAIRIEASNGGRIGDYIALFDLIRERGEQVVIDGPCLSACTLVLSVVPSERICVTNRAVLGFHAAWTPDAQGRPLQHARATQLMLETYPPPVRAWINRNGGLSKRTILLRGRALGSLYARCT
jgi:hypothetical protein